MASIQQKTYSPPLFPAPCARTTSSASSGTATGWKARRQRARPPAVPRPQCCAPLAVACTRVDVRASPSARGSEMSSRLPPAGTGSGRTWKHRTLRKDRPKKSKKKKIMSKNTEINQKKFPVI